MIFEKENWEWIEYGKGVGWKSCSCFEAFQPYKNMDKSHKDNSESN